MLSLIHIFTAKPEADYYDAFINPDDCTNIRTTAKELKIPERKVVQFLLREKYLFRSPSGDVYKRQAQCAVQAAGEVRGGTGAEWYPRGQRTHTDNADAEYPLPSV